MGEIRKDYISLFTQISTRKGGGGVVVEGKLKPEENKGGKTGGPTLMSGMAACNE